MHFRTSLFLLAIVCSAQSIANELSWDGYGEIMFGTSVEDISRSTGLEFIPTQDGRDWEEACKYMDVKGDKGIRYMVENGVLTRAEVPVSTPTLLKIDISKSISEIKEQHPEAIVKNHKYAMDGHYIIFYNSNKSKALLLEYYESKVQIMRAGVVPSVLYVEGCL